MWLEIQFKGSRPLVVCFIYRPPNSLISWFDTFNEQLERATLKNYETILLGDLNIDLKCDLYSNERNVLEDITQVNNFIQMVKEYTRVTPNTRTLSDHIYVNNAENIQEINVPHISISDHYAVCITRKKKQGKA